MIAAALAWRLGLAAIVSLTVFLGAATGMRWLLDESRLHGADCVVGDERPGRVLGPRCFALDAERVRIRLAEEAQLADLNDFSAIKDLTIFMEDDQVDLDLLLNHAQLETLRLQGPISEPFGSFASLDFAALTEMPRLREIKLNAMADVDLRFLNDVRGLEAVQLLIVDAAFAPDFRAMDLRRLELSLTSFPDRIDLGRMDRLVELKLSEMAELHSQIGLAFPNMRELRVTGALSREGELLDAILQLDQLVDVYVRHPGGPPVRGREAVIEFLSGRIE